MTAQRRHWRVASRLIARYGFAEARRRALAQFRKRSARSLARFYWLSDLRMAVDKLGGVA